MKTYLSSAADISEDEIYRYSLTRQLGSGTSTVVFIGLNPSTADALRDDPTIRREVGFAEEWGFDWYLKGNLYAYRATHPKVLRRVADPMGPRNIATLRALIDRAELVVAAWGRFKLNTQGRDLANRILVMGKTRCLGFNNDGSPRHPLYLPKGTPLGRYERT